MTTPQSSKPTAVGSRRRRDSLGTPTMIAIAKANFAKCGRAIACERMTSIDPTALKSSLGRITGRWRGRDTFSLSLLSTPVFGQSSGYPLKDFTVNSDVDDVAALAPEKTESHLRCHQLREVAHLVQSLLVVADPGLHQQAGHAVLHLHHLLDYKAAITKQRAVSTYRSIRPLPANMPRHIVRSHPWARVASSSSCPGSEARRKYSFPLRRFLLLLVKLLELFLHKHLLFFRRELWEQESNLQPHAPRRSPCWIHSVPVKLRCEVHWLEAQLHHPAHTAVKGNRPHVAAAGPPMRGDDRRRRDVPTLLDLVSDEVLVQHLVDRRAASRTRHGPYVIHQIAQRPLTRLGQNYDRWTQAELSLSQNRVGSGRNHHGRANAPDQLSRPARRKEEGGNHTAESVLSPGVLVGIGLPHQRLNDARDHHPVLADVDGNHWLNVQHILGAIERPIIKVGVVSQRHANEAGDRILHRLLQRLVRRLRCACRGRWLLGGRSRLILCEG